MNQPGYVDINYQPMEGRSYQIHQILSNLLAGLTMNDTILSHEFAKLFWGEETYVSFFDGYVCERYTITEIEAMEKTNLICVTGYHHDYRKREWFQPIWAYHLQRMVLEEDKLSYLIKFL